MRTSTLSRTLAVALASSILLPSLVLAQSSAATTSSAMSSSSAYRGDSGSERSRPEKFKPTTKPKPGVTDLTADQLTQVQAAVAAREQALASAASTFGSSLSAAFEKRATALSSAWAMTDATARKNAIKAAWDTFKKDAKAAKQTYRAAQKAAWDTFKAAVKSIKGIPAEDSGSETIQ